MSSDPARVEWEFAEVPEEEIDYSGVPPGTYLCRVEEARPGQTRTGHARWALKFVVHDGPEAGRVAAWDGLTFSPKASGRTRQVLAALGLPHSGRVQLHASSLVGRTAFVTVENRVYRNPVTGVTTKRNSVPFGGVRPVEGEARTEDAGGGEESDAARTPTEDAGGGGESDAARIPF